MLGVLKIRGLMSHERRRYARAVGPRYTVFLRRRADFTADQLRAGVADGLRLVAERAHQPALGEIAARLAVEATGADFVAHDGTAKVQVERCPGDRIRDAVADAAAKLAPALSANAALLDHLGATVDVFWARFAVDSVREGGMIAANVARWLARDYDGVIWGAAGDWIRLGERHQFVDIGP